MHLPAKNLFNLLKVPFDYNVNKKTIKENYFNLSKELNKTESSPDSNSLLKRQLLNEAYKTITDDLSRAKLFTEPAKDLDRIFLEKCIEMEERIIKGENIKNELEEKIEKCKENYRDPVEVGKWGYYHRLLELLR